MKTKRDYSIEELESILKKKLIFPNYRCSYWNENNTFNGRTYDFFRELLKEKKAYNKAINDFVKLFRKKINKAGNIWDLSLIDETAKELKDEN